MLLTRPPLPPVPKHPRTCDLHVLGTPPAFILSQDQTRHPCSMSPPPTNGRAVELHHVCARSRPSVHRVDVRGCSQIVCSPSRALRAEQGRSSPHIDRNCCVRVGARSPSCCSAFHSSIVKVPQKQVMPASSLPFGDKYSTPGAKSRFTERRSWVQFLLRRNLQEVYLIEVTTPSLLATKLLCHSSYPMSRVFGKIFVNL